MRNVDEGVVFDLSVNKILHHSLLNLFIYSMRPNIKSDYDVKSAAQLAVNPSLLLP